MACNPVQRPTKGLQACGVGPMHILDYHQHWIVQSPKNRSRRCCETMIFVLSSFIRLSEPISRGTVTGQRNSTTRLRVSCHPSRTSEHSSVGAAKRRESVRMFG